MALRGEAERPTYRILGQVSGGSVGDPVYHAYHEVFRGPCFQKTVSMHGLEDALAANEPAFLERVNHPHVVKVREAQWDPTHDGAITFVMPAYEGGSIEDALRQDYRFSIYQAITLAQHMLGALAHVYREFNAVHRDAKPGNILLDEERQNAYLSDFGSAATLDSSGEAAAVRGTDHYRPPEAKATGRVGVGADLYGVGMTAFEMVNGRLRWEDFDFPTIESRLKAGRRALPDGVLAVYAPHVPEPVRRVVNKAIARKAKDRFSSPEEFIRALDKAKLRSVDWRHVDGVGLEGTWLGTWPPQRRRELRTTYRVCSRPLAAGRDRGKLRLTAHYKKAGSASWRRVVPDATIEPGDVRAVRDFFSAVEAKAAQREPAR
jgi:serine/threonine protein kinase